MLKSLSKRSLFLFLCDSFGVVISYFLALAIKSQTIHITIYFPPFLFAAILIVAFIFYIFDLYYPFKHFGKSQTLVDVSIAVIISLIILGAISYLDRTLLVARSIFALAGLILIAYVFLLRLLYDYIFKSRFLDKRVLILGSGNLAQEMVAIIKSVPHSGMEIIGFVYENEPPSQNVKMNAPVVGGMKELLSLVDWYNIDVVVMALDSEKQFSEARILSNIMVRKISVTSAIHLYERVAGEIPYHLLDEHFLLSLMSQVRMRPYLKIKRLVDVAAGSILLLVFSPVLLLSVLLLSLGGPSKVFFVQKRVGQDGRLFNLIKLRTMTIDQSKKSQRVTIVGRFLRKYRIDEFPQLLNVIAGSMSLIGPRPEVPFFVERSRKKIPFYETVFAIKPGLTGWAQVNMSHVTSVKDYDKKFKYNLYYLKNISLTLDMMILLRTIRVIVFGKGK